MNAQTDMKIHRLIQEAVVLGPDDEAVYGYNGRLTYKQLQIKWTSITETLAFEAPGTQVVPIIMDKSIWAVAAILGVLQAGAAFVLIDPSTVKTRLHSIFSQTRAECCICDSESVAISVGLVERVVVVDHTGSLVCLRNEKTTKAAVASTNYLDSMAAGEAAYIVFTSGSTGEPKGVVVSHKAFCAGVYSQAAGLRIYRQSRVLQMASFSFSACIVEILTTLAVGGCVCIPSSYERFNALEQAFRRLKPTWMVTQPSLLRRLKTSFTSSLETLAVGGESASDIVLEPWQNSDKVSLVHAYGQSESCTICCAREINDRAAVDYRNIGAGLNTTLWIVDPVNANKRMPRGQVGELLLNSDAIASGYLITPPCHANPFIKRPGWAEPSHTNGERWYLTGDLALELPDGTVSLRGRKDFQLNLHGQRIEPVEVEQQILLHMGDEIRDIAITTLANGVNLQILAAFCVPRHDDDEGVIITKADNDSNGKRENLSNRQDGQDMPWLSERMLHVLSDKLPSYMIPTRCISISGGLPKTASGKLARKKLTEIMVTVHSSDLVCGNNSIAPAIYSPNEERLSHGLLELWATVLGVARECVKPDSDFFVDGGDSIAALSLANMAREAKMPLTYQQIFLQRRFGAILQSLASCEKQQISTTETYKAENDFSARNCIFRPGSMPSRIIEANLSESMGLSFQFHLSFSDGVNGRRIHNAFKKCFEKHEMLRATFHQTKTTGAFSMEILPLDTLCLSWEYPDTDAAAFTSRKMESEQTRFVLGQPFASLTMIEARDGSLSALLRLSHAQFDGMSLTVLWDDLVSAYDTDDDFVRNECLSMQHALAMIGTSTKGSRLYWEQRLTGAVPSNVTPTPALTTNRDAIVDQDVWTAIQHTPELLQKTTLACAVYTTWAIVLSRLSGSEDVCFSYLVNGRVFGPPMDRAVFCFANELILRIKVLKVWSALSLVAQVESQQLDGLEHSNFGLGDAVEAAGWDPLTCVSSFVQHQNIEERHTLAFKDGYCSVEYKENEVDFEDLRLFTRPRRGGVEIHLQSSSKRFSPTELKSLLDEVCATFHLVEAQVIRCI